MRENHVFILFVNLIIGDLFVSLISFAIDNVEFALWLSQTNEMPPDSKENQAEKAFYVHSYAVDTGGIRWKHY